MKSGDSYLHRTLVTAAGSAKAAASSGSDLAAAPWPLPPTSSRRTPLHSLTGPVGQLFASCPGGQRGVPTLTMEPGSPVSDVINIE
jgi:hypothetical protein